MEAVEKRGRGRPKTEQRLAVEERLRALADEHGRITPDTVLEDARNPDSPLHSEFEWDDAVAGEAHRLGQARALIKTVKIVVETNEVKIRVPAYTRDPDAAAEEQGYRSVLSVNPESEEDVARRMLLQEIVRTEEALARALGYAEIFDLDEEIIGIRSSVGDLKRKLAA